MAYEITMKRPFLTEHPITYVVERREEAKNLVLTCMDLTEYSPDSVQIIIEKVEDKEMP